MVKSNGLAYYACMMSFSNTKNIFKLQFKESLDVIVRSAKFRTLVKLRKTKQFSESMGIVVIHRQQENT